jgi:hypothetical protein
MMDMFGYDPDDEEEDRRPKNESTNKIQKDKKPQQGDIKHQASRNTHAPSHDHANMDPAQSKHSGSTAAKPRPNNKGFDMAPTKVNTAAKFMLREHFVAEHLSAMTSSVHP